MNSAFELLLFAATPEIAGAAQPAGIDAVVVDWENRGKEGRQAGRDTQINHQTVRDLAAIRRATPLKVVCRVNALGEWTADEIGAAIGEGADEILLPMVRTVDDVTRTRDIIGGRCPLGILIETVDAVRHASSFDAAGISRAYVGLNDLAIERGTDGLFDALVDGTVDDVRRKVNVPFGFGGLTIPDRGHPVPCALLIAEMARLRCHFTFLRRSFLRDVTPDAFPAAIARIREAVGEAARRDPEDVVAARQALADAVMACQ